MSAQAQLRQAQINLAYTEIHAPVSGKISRTSITVGNVVSPSSGPLGDYRQPGPDVCAVSGRVARPAEIEKRYADKGGMNAVVVKLRLPDGAMYGQTGKIDYVEPSVSATTDTILLRARIANPAASGRRETGSRSSGRWSMAPSSPCWSRASSR